MKKDEAQRALDGLEGALDRHLIIAALVLIALLAWLLVGLTEAAGVYSPVTLSSLFFFVAAAFGLGWFIFFTTGERAKKDLRQQLEREEEEEEEEEKRKDVVWLHKYQNQVTAILDNPSWWFYLKSLAQEPSSSKQKEAFEKTIELLLEQMEEVSSLDKSRLVFNALRSRILGDLEASRRYAQSKGAELDAEKNWKYRIDEISGILTTN